MTERSEEVLDGIRPGFCVSQSPESDFISKGMMKDGVRPIRVTMFILRKYSVIYRLQSLG